MSFAGLHSDGTPNGTAWTDPGEAEGRVQGESTWWVGGVAHSPIANAINERSALRIPAVLSSTNVVSTDVSLLPLNVFQKLPGVGSRDANDHPVDELLTRSPDGVRTPLNWKRAWMGHALIHGNGYAEIQRLGRGTPYKLHLLDPETTHAEARGDLDGYRIDGGGWLEAANVLHIAGFGYDGLCGYSFVQLMRQTLGLGLAAETFGADYFANGSEPRGVIETPERLKGQARRDLEENWQADYGGANRHRTAVLMGGAKFNPITNNPESSQLLETRKFQVLDSIRPWRVPPHKVGDFSEAHLANIEASNIDYLMTALMSWLVAIEQEVNLKLFTRAEWKAGYYVKHNTNALLRADTMRRFGGYEIATRNGWMNRDEVRALEELNPIGAGGGGQLYTVQSQNVSLKLVGKAKAAPIPAPFAQEPKDPNA